MEAHFELEGTTYSIPDGPADIIKLPDGRLFRINYWIETYPSQPGGLEEISEDDAAGCLVIDVAVVG